MELFHKIEDDMNITQRNRITGKYNMHGSTLKKKLAPVVEIYVAERYLANKL